MLESASAHISSIREKEVLIYEYIRDIGSLFQPMRYSLDNPMGLYSDYNFFKKHFVKFWKNALDLCRDDMDDIRDIFDEEMSFVKIGRLCLCILKMVRH